MSSKRQSLIGTAEAARRLRCTQWTVARLATRHGIGRKGPGGAYSFTPEDFAELRAILRPGPGNPGWVRQPKP